MVFHSSTEQLAYLMQVPGLDHMGLGQVGWHQVLHFLSIGQGGRKGIYFREETPRGKLRDLNVSVVGISDFEVIRKAGEHLGVDTL